MPVTDRRPRTARAPAAGGYLGGVIINAVFLYLVNVNPGWQAVPWLTDATTQVLGALNASIVAAIVVNLVYVITDARPIRMLGSVVTSVFALVALVRIWRVFPFDFTGASSDWTLITRVVLGFAIGGTIIGVIASVLFLRNSRPAADRR